MFCLVKTAISTHRATLYHNKQDEILFFDFPDRIDIKLFSVKQVFNDLETIVSGQAFNLRHRAFVRMFGLHSFPFFKVKFPVQCRNSNLLVTGAVNMAFNSSGSLIVIGFLNKVLFFEVGSQLLIDNI